MYSERGSNPHDPCRSQDFKSGVSTYSTIRALRRRTIVQKYYFYLILQNLCVDICYYLFDLFGGEPRYLGVAPEPRHLAFGIAAGVALDGFDRLVETRLMVDIVEYLAIPYRLQSVAVAQRQQRPHLVFESVGHHAIYPQIDASIQLRPLDVGAYLDRSERTLPTSAGTQLRVLPAA